MIRSLSAFASSRDIVRDVNGLLPAVEQHVRTDLTPIEIAELGKQYASTCSEGRFQLDALARQVERLDVENPLSRQQLAYVVVDPEAIAPKVAVLLRRDSCAP